MKMHRRTAGIAVGALLLALVGTASATDAVAAGDAERTVPNVIEIAQAPEAQPRELAPRYEPVPPQPKSWYNDSYIFAGTRGVADSTMEPAVKVLLYVLTVPFDLVALPFAAIGGLFG